MIKDKTDRLVEDYLDAVERELTGVAPRERRELVEDLTEHIRSERAGLETDSEAGVRQILDRLGSPATVAAAAKAESTSAPVAAAVPAVRNWTRILLIVLGVVVSLVIVLFMLFFSTNTTMERPVPVESTSIDVG